MIADEQAAQAAADKAKALLLELDPATREEALTRLRYNGVFCAECGQGSPEHPNPTERCNCTNDE